MCFCNSTDFMCWNNKYSLLESYGLFIYIIIYIYLFKHMIWNQIFSATATVVDPDVCDNRQLSLILFVVFILWYEYGVTYFLLAYFILSIDLSKTISTGLVDIKTKKAILSLVFDHNLFLWFDWIYFFKQHKVIVWVILIISLHCFIFHFSNIWFKNQINGSISIVVSPVVSDNWKSSFFLFAVLIHSWDYVVEYLWWTNFILSIVWSTNIFTSFVSITANKVCLFLFLIKICF